MEPQPTTNHIRNIAVRLPEELYLDLMGLAIVDSSARERRVSLGEVVRNGLRTYVEVRRSLPGFEADVESARQLRQDTIGFSEA